MRKVFRFWQTKIDFAYKSSFDPWSLRLLYWFCMGITKFWPEYLYKNFNKYRVKILNILVRYLKCLSPEESCECRSRMGSNRFYLCFNYSELCSRNVLGCFKNTNIIRFFEILNMLYPPKGAAIAEPVWGPIDFSYVLFRSTKGT